MPEPDQKKVKEYIWAKYVDFSAPAEEIDDDLCLRVLEDHFRKTPIAEDGENYYLGILLFETADNHPDRRRSMLAAAKILLEGYRERSGERNWDPIEDRLADLEDMLAKIPEKERAALLEKTAREYAPAEAAAPAEEPEAAAAPGMVLVPAGPFLSGAAKSLRETGAYWIDTFPVTNEEFAAFCQATGYRHPKFWAEGRMRNPRAPVVGISWYDAYKYASWAGKALPSAEQWEKAARGKAGRIFPWGDQIDHNKAVYGQPDATDAVAEVGLCAENVSEYGARDMVGNVWQWTDTWDRQEPEMKVICGGSWCDPVEFLRLDGHLATNPKDKFDNIGFRCIKSAE